MNAAPLDTTPGGEQLQAAAVDEAPAVGGSGVSGAALPVERQTSAPDTCADVHEQQPGHENDSLEAAVQSAGEQARSG